MSRKRLLGFLWLAACLAACGQSSAPQVAGELPLPSAAADGRPLTIPALREWAPLPGTFELGTAPRIVVGADALADTASLLADELAALSGRRVEVARGEAAAGDVLLKLDATDDTLRPEGYRLELERAAVISAPSVVGVFYGTRSLLQMLAQGARLPAGVALDWPRYPERGLMVDMGRKYFTLDFLKARVRELAYLKMNLLHLHFSESLGFRIESRRHPEVMSAEYLTQDQLRELLALAARYHVTVVPEIDMPGHMEQALKAHPEFQLKNSRGQAQVDKLDITNEAARAFARDLVGEYMALFPGPYWHLGADEFLGVGVPFAVNAVQYPALRDYARAKHGAGANAKDAFLDFINEMDDFIRAGGKSTRVWNDGQGDGAAVTIHPGLVVEQWTEIDGNTPKQSLADGQNVLNAGWFPTYWVLASRPVPDSQPDMRATYEQWEVNEFYGLANFTVGGQAPLGLPPQVLDEEDPRILGSKLQLWCDTPDLMTEQEVDAGINDALRVIAQKTWNSPLLTPVYAEFQAVILEVGEAP